MTEHDHGPGVLDPLRGEGRALRALIPEVYAAHATVGEAAMGDGALNAFTKELVAFAISVSKQCDGCIASHAQKLAKLGASEEQVAEVIGVAIMMNGGPGTVYGPRALAAFRSFAAAVR